MNYYLLQIDSLCHVFSLIESGKDFLFKYQLIDNDNVNNILTQLNNNDEVLCSINDRVSIVFSVIKKDNNCFFNKKIDIENGYELSTEMIQKLNESTILRIDNETAEKIKKKIFNFSIESTKFYPPDKPHNRIIFGAPGTGKSHLLCEDQKKYFPCIKQIQTRDEYIEKKIKKEISQKPDSKNLGDWAAAVAIKYSQYFNRLEIWFDTTKPGGSYVDFLSKTFELNAKQPELMISAYRGINILNKSNDDYALWERVTFHPNYSYAQFVGTYKPVQGSSDEKQIAYQYVPGPFMRIYAAAKQNQNNNYLLLIEEINRANVAAVFGDVFQLLDRKSNGESEYPVAASEDIKKYLAKKGIYEDELSIPSNMYIWATMNSADQGVFPMDTAFKRRWEFEYIGIDDNEDKVKDYKIPINSNQKVNWNELRKAINTRLIEMSINEDKLLGPFFLSKTVLENAVENPENFVKLFKSKVIMYLFEDAAKMKVKQLFKIDNNKYIFSEICKQFDEKGLDVFQIDISNIKLSENDNTKEDVVVSEGNTGTTSLFEQ